MKKKINVYNEALRLFLQEDIEKMKIASGAVYNSEEQSFLLEYFGQKCSLCTKTGEISLLEDGVKLSQDDKTLILQYMVQSSGLPPRGRWISFLELPGGPLHYVPLQNDAFRPLAKVFGNNEAGFKRVAQMMGGTLIEMGDIAFMVYALPKLPLAVVLWLGDEEFPPKAAILYDSVAETQLSTASLWVLGCRAAAKLIDLS